MEDKKQKNKMYILVLVIPLISATIAGLFGRKVGEIGAGIITTSLILITSIISWFIWYEVGICGAVTYIDIGTWIESGLLNIKYGLVFDSVSATMLILVTTVSGLVHWYSTEYMRGDPHKPRFMAYLSMFTFFMVVLVTADNYVQLFIGWEGVGLCSYLLINFWFTRIQANKSAMKAMIVNRVGDIGLALGMIVAFKEFKALDYATIFSMVPTYENSTIVFLGGEFNSLTVIGILILIGAIGKSAQLGLHTWLPDAMEGPTPVSALIHAATMVTAGVFVLIRSSPLLEYAPTVLISVTVIGGLTALFAASVGLVQNDIKKVIAYSTCSQLGYMVLACGLSNYTTSLFHLVNHGFFKALLFLSAGSVIHGLMDEQDMRKFGGLIGRLPLTYTMILIGSLSLMGFPFLTGFYSKDAILEYAYGVYTIEGTWGHWLGTVAAFFTAFYSARLLYLTFLSKPTARQYDYENSHESPKSIWMPLLILGLGSIFFGYITRDMIIGLGTSYFGNSIFVLPKNAGAAIDAEFIATSIKWIPVIFSISGGIVAILLYLYLGNELSPYKMSDLRIKIYTFLSNKWHIDQIYNAYIVKPILYAGHDITYKALDRGIIEQLGPTGIASGIKSLTINLSNKVQSGEIYNYALTIFVFATVFIAIAAAGPSWALLSGSNSELFFILVPIILALFV